MTTLLSAITVVPLVVGGIGIMNIILVRVTEWTREIGVRTAVGARSWHILGQFLAEALALSLVGGASGIALGLTIAGQLAACFHMPSVIHWNVIALAVGFSAAIGGGSGCTPRARRRDSTRSMRCAPSDRRVALPGMDDRLDAVVVGGAGGDTNVYLAGDDIDWSVETNFTCNVGCVGQADSQSSRLLARLGKCTGYIGPVGDDHGRRLVRDTLARNGVDLTGLFVDPGGTNRSINLVYRDGRRKNFYDGRGSMTLQPDLALFRGVLARARLTHFSIVHWARQLLPIAREFGAAIAVDLEDVVAADDPYRQDFVDGADILMLSGVRPAAIAAASRFSSATGRVVAATAAPGPESSRGTERQSRRHGTKVGVAECLALRFASARTTVIFEATVALLGLPPVLSRTTCSPTHFDPCMMEPDPIARRPCVVGLAPCGVVRALLEIAQEVVL